MINRSIKAKVAAIESQVHPKYRQPAIGPQSSEEWAWFLNLLDRLELRSPEPRLDRLTVQDRLEWERLMPGVGVKSFAATLRDIGEEC